MKAVLVNHNTSHYAELALRSLITLNPDVALGATVMRSPEVPSSITPRLRSDATPRS